MATAVTYRRAISVLASHLGCEPDEETVYARRLATDPDEYAASLLRATNTEMLLFDEGFPPAGAGTTTSELGELAGCAGATGDANRAGGGARRDRGDATRSPPR